MTAGAIGMAKETIAADASGEILLKGIARDDTWNWTVGATLYLSLTTGGITATQPSATNEVIQVLGRATHADRIFLNPSLIYITHI